MLNMLFQYLLAVSLLMRLGVAAPTPLPADVMEVRSCAPQASYPPPQQYPQQQYPQQQYPPQKYPQTNYPPQQYPPQKYPPQQYAQPQYPPQQYAQQPQYAAPAPILTSTPAAVIDQFRKLVVDTDQVLSAIQAYQGLQAQADSITFAERRLNADAEVVIYTTQIAPVNFIGLVQAQPTIIKFLRNSVKATNALVAKKALLKQAGAAWYFLQVLQEQKALVGRMHAAFDAKASPIVKLGAKVEFKVVDDALDKAISGWSSQ
jgi:hypothetical protein